MLFKHGSKAFQESRYRLERTCSSSYLSSRLGLSRFMTSAQVGHRLPRKPRTFLHRSLQQSQIHPGDVRVSVSKAVKKLPPGTVEMSPIVASSEARSPVSQFSNGHGRRATHDTQGPSSGRSYKQASRKYGKPPVKLLVPYNLSLELKESCSSGDIDGAIHRLQSTPRDAQNTSVWNTMISQCMHAGKYQRSFEIFTDVS